MLKNVHRAAPHQQSSAWPPLARANQELQDCRAGTETPCNEKRRKGIIFPSFKARLAALLMEPPPFPWPRAAGCELCLTGVQRGVCRSISAGRRWPQLARAPTVSLQVRLKATQAPQQGHRDISLPPLLLRVHVTAGTTPHSHGRPAPALQNSGPENIWMFKTRMIAPV